MVKTIIARLGIKREKTQEFLKLAEIMINKSIDEDGCLIYKLSKEIGNENTFLFYEKYKDDEAVEKHNSSEYFKKFINSVTPLLTEEPKIEVF